MFCMFKQYYRIVSLDPAASADACARRDVASARRESVRGRIDERHFVSLSGSSVFSPSRGDERTNERTLKGGATDDEDSFEICRFV